MPHAARDQLALIRKLCECSTHLTAEVERAVDREAALGHSSRLRPDDREAPIPPAVPDGPRHPED